MVNCTYTRHSAIPDGLLNSTITTLVFEFNALTAVPTTQLAQAPYLEVLNLNYNLITAIMNDSFSTTPNLRVLRLGGNILLREMDVDVFNPIPFLTELSIVETGLTTLSRNHFAPLTRLQTLIFAANYEMNPTPDLFAALRKVNAVDIWNCGALSTALANQSFGLSTLPRLTRLFVLRRSYCRVNFPNENLRAASLVRVIAKFIINSPDATV